MASTHGGVRIGLDLGFIDLEKRLNGRQKQNLKIHQETEKQDRNGDEKGQESSDEHNQEGGNPEQIVGDHRVSRLDIVLSKNILRHP